MFAEMSQSLLARSLVASANGYLVAAVNNLRVALAMNYAQTVRESGSRIFCTQSNIL